MNALILPGNSPRHAEWAEKLKQAVTPHFETTKVQHYQHWKTGEQWADVDNEILVAIQNTSTLDPYTVIAKSIGTAIATKGTAKHTLYPTRLILLGVPILGGVSRDAFADWLGEIDVPVTIIQNTSDPLGSFSEIVTSFQNVSADVSFIELPGDTHDYIDFEAITNVI